ncbi:MAG: glycosyltransferase family 4 protein [Bacteroidetes bacterium]|nr:glycosyltransferase family 4 protein [Bacteroidota bacterium]
MPDSLKVLFICNKSPWPPGEGGPIAMNNLITGLIEAGHQVKVLAVNSNKYSVDPDRIPEDYKKSTGIELAYVDLAIKPLDAFLNLFSNKSYHVERFISKGFHAKLIEILKRDRFDVVQIETLYMSPYIETIREYTGAKIFLRAHNIEHMIWQRIMESTKNPIKKWYLKHLVRTLRNYEYNSLVKYDGIIPISYVDAKFFSGITKTPVRAISFGIDPDQIDKEIYGKPENALFHIGSMNWVPNIEGIKWFLEEAWPLIHETFPELKCYLAGRGMPDWIYQMQLENVEVVGEVPDAYEFIKSKAISIAPLFSGSGIRIKIIESMAQARAVISTTIGAEGINYTNGEHIMIADDQQTFLEAVRFLYPHPERSKKMGENARKLILQQHNNKLLIEQMVDFYREVIK